MKRLKQKRVYYSFPPPPRGFDVSAEVEIMIDEGKFYAVPRMEQLNGLGENAEVIDVAVIASCKSIQMTAVHRLNVEALVEQTEIIFKACTKLEELHWHNANHVYEVLTSPHAIGRLSSLKVLSIPFASNFTPVAFACIQHCKLLERLDLRYSFDIQESVMSHSLSNMFCDGDEENPPTPYLGVLLGLLECCSNLKFIDLEGIADPIPGVGTELEYTIGLRGILECIQAGVKVKGSAKHDMESDNEEDDLEESSEED